MPGGYPNGHGVYNPSQAQYSSGFHPSNPFYCADPQRPAAGPYPNPGCPAEQNSGPSGQPHSQHQHPHYPGPHGQGVMAYCFCYISNITEINIDFFHSHFKNWPPNAFKPSISHWSARSQPPPEAWTHSGAYAPPQQQWAPGQQTPQNPYGNPVRPPHPPAWPGTGTGAPPPYQPKISSPPQMYNRPSQSESSGPNQTPAQSQSPAPGQPTLQPLSDNPSLAKVQQIMIRVQLLQEDVDEFVGKKTDKSYRCLEELLTKELLELDSVETQGQETVRQARKEAVQRIQAILDRLEKKAF
uniref:BCL2 associated athanogene 4 n=1 Tax=Neogobius melanostomus TaxID=47308 RepID=A0A8C6UZI4_9GOBI